jgi:hypothetical protein
MDNERYLRKHPEISQILHYFVHEAIQHLAFSKSNDDDQPLVDHITSKLPRLIRFDFMYISEIATDVDLEVKVQNYHQERLQAQKDGHWLDNRTVQDLIAPDNNLLDQ